MRFWPISGSPCLNPFCRGASLDRGTSHPTMLGPSRSTISMRAGAGHLCFRIRRIRRRFGMAMSRPLCAPARRTLHRRWNGEVKHRAARRGLLTRTKSSAHEKRAPALHSPQMPFRFSENRPGRKTDKSRTGVTFGLSLRPTPHHQTVLIRLTLKGTPPPTTGFPHRLGCEKRKRGARQAPWRVGLSSSISPTFTKPQRKRTFCDAALLGSVYARIDPIPSVWNP